MGWSGVGSKSFSSVTLESKIYFRLVLFNPLQLSQKSSNTNRMKYFGGSLVIPNPYCNLHGSNPQVHLPSHTLRTLPPLTPPHFLSDVKDF